MKNAKNVVRVVAVGFVLTFTVIGCNEIGQEKSAQTAKPDIAAPSQIIEIEEAKSMYDNYTQRRVPLIQHFEDSLNRNHQDKKSDKSTEDRENQAKPFDVARYVYYDYKTIKDYMAYIEQEAKSAGVEISTLRFYFSNYNGNQNFPGTKDAVKHPHQNSILLSPTLKKGERDYLFYVAQGKEGQEAVLLDDEFGTPKGMGLLPSEDKTAHASLAPIFFKPSSKPLYSGTSLTMNRGQGAPPPYAKK